MKPRVGPAAVARPIKTVGVDAGKENSDDGVAFKSKDAAAKRVQKMTEISNTQHAMKTRIESHSKNAIPLRKVQTGATTTATQIPRPATTVRAPRDWKKVHEEEEKRKQKRMEELRRPVTQPVEVTIGHHTAHVEAPTSQAGPHQVPRRAGMPTAGPAQDFKDDFKADENALQSILSNVGITDVSTTVRKSLAAAASQAQSHQRDLQESYATIQSLRARMSTYVGPNAAPLLAAPTEPVTPGRMLANLLLPSERRRLTVAAGAKPPSPTTLAGPRAEEFTTTLATIDARFTERETAMARAAPGDELVKRASVYHGGPVRLPTTNKKAVAPAVSFNLPAAVSSPVNTARQSMYVPTPMQHKTGLADAANPTTPMPRMSMPAMRDIGKAFAVAMTTPSVAAPPPSVDEFDGVPADMDLDKYLDAQLAAEAARTQALMASAMAIPAASKAVEKIASQVRGAFVPAARITAVPIVVPAAAAGPASLNESWDAELAALTSLPASNHEMRLLPEPVARQVDEPFDRIRVISEEKVSMFKPSTLFKAVR
eukprot:m.250954 g.250954  ORF g.250954 m.250954 type:complete len:542 (-) comp16951_c0_seq1:85-1710(-)